MPGIFPKKEMPDETEEDHPEESVWANDDHGKRKCIQPGFKI